MEKLDPAIQLIENLLAESREKDKGGDLQTAITCAQQALAEAQQANAFPYLPRAQLQLARLLSQIGHYAEARRLALSVLESDHGAALAADAWTILGVCAAETNDLVGGEENYHRAIDLGRETGYLEGLASALHNLATSIYLPRGQFDLALRAMEDAQQVKSKAGSQDWGLPFLQAYIFELTGNLKRARQALDSLLPLFQPGTRGAGNYFYLWARLALEEEALEQAEEYLHLLVRIANTTGAPDLNIWSRVEYSHYYRLKGDPAAACNWAGDGLTYARRIGHQILTGEALIEHAQASWENGDQETALRFLQEAQEILRPHHAAYLLARAAFLQACWFAVLQRPEAEEAWLQAAHALTSGGYTFLLERERDTAFPLVASYMRSRNKAARQAAETLLQALARVSPANLRINGLGGFVVWQGRKRIPDQNWQRRKAGDLFRFLLLQPHRSAGREVILEALWPDSPPQAAMDLLHQATSTLRHILEPDLPDKFPSRYLNVEGERVWLNLPEGSLVDFDEFERRLPLAIQSRRVDQLQPALALYRNELFPQDRYSDWSTSRREQLSQLYQRGLLAIGQAYLANEQFLEAVDCSRVIIQSDPWSEDAVLLGMNAYLGLRDAPRAVQLYHKLEGVLQEELGLVPRSDLRALVEKLRKQGL